VTLCIRRCRGDYVRQFELDDLHEATADRPGLEVPSDAEIVHTESGRVLATRNAYLSRGEIRHGWSLTPDGIDFTAAKSGGALDGGVG
jgi:hypothetical protein